VSCQFVVLENPENCSALRCRYFRVAPNSLNRRCHQRFGLQGPNSGRSPFREPSSRLVVETVGRELVNQTIVMQLCGYLSSILNAKVVTINQTQHYRTAPTCRYSYCRLFSELKQLCSYPLERTDEYSHRAIVDLRFERERDATSRSNKDREFSRRFTKLRLEARRRQWGQTSDGRIDRSERGEAHGRGGGSWWNSPGCRT
jgi:hypothetical protein